MMNFKTRANLQAFMTEYNGKTVRYMESYNGTTWATVKRYIDMTTELVVYRHYVDPYEDQLMTAEGVLWDEDEELYYVEMSYHRYTILGWKDPA